jgi:hypothetical protein
LLLSLDGDADIRVLLEVDQSIEPVFAGEACDQLVLVLVIPPLEVIADADVQDPSATGHDVNPIALHDHSLTLSGKSLRVDPSSPPLTLRLARDDKESVPASGQM